jgi:AraC-like DNA-binding protein
MNHSKHTEILCRLVRKYSSGDGIHDTAIPSLHCIQSSVTGIQLPSLYQPSLCVIVQGAKQVTLHDETLHYSPAQHLLASVDLPLIGEVTQATPENPYYCIQLDLDAPILSELIEQLHLPPVPRVAQLGIFVTQTDEQLLDAVTRLICLLDTPDDIPYLAPLLIREIHYRLLKSEAGLRIAQFALQGSHTQRIAQAIQILKEKYNEPLTVEALASAVHMSPSSFHAHFKAVTAQSPLQYQKRLRLMAARQLMLSGAANAASAAYRVGYESASQFSREYARAYGAPPATDVESLRAA